MNKIESGLNSGQSYEQVEREKLTQRLFKTFETRRILNKRGISEKLCSSKDITGDPLVALELYAFDAVGFHKETNRQLGKHEEASLEEAEEAVKVCEAILAEAKEQENQPVFDLSKIDFILGNFLFSRLQNFSKTLGKRKEATAEYFKDCYKDAGDERQTKDYWRKIISKDLKKADDALAEASNYDDMFKAGEYSTPKLMSKGQTIAREASILLDANPFALDDYKQN